MPKAAWIHAPPNVKKKQAPTPDLQKAAWIHAPPEHTKQNADQCCQNLPGSKRHPNTKKTKHPQKIRQNLPPLGTQQNAQTIAATNIPDPRDPPT